MTIQHEYKWIDKAYFLSLKGKLMWYMHSSNNGIFMLHVHPSWELVIPLSIFLIILVNKTQRVSCLGIFFTSVGQ